MVLLVVALALLLLPAFVAGWIRRTPALASALDGMAVTTILGLVTLFILPDAAADAGPAALAAAVVGLALPRLAERVGVSIGAVHAASALAGLAALLVHASLDGVALAAAAHGAPALGLSVALHQVPVGLAVYASHRRRFGLSWALLALCGMAVVTVAGFVPLLFAHHPVMFQLGHALTWGALGTYLGSVFGLPWLYRRWGKIA